METLGTDGFPVFSLAPVHMKSLMPLGVCAAALAVPAGASAVSAPLKLAPAPRSATGHGPIGMAVGDFNGDGRADIAIVNSGDNTVSILLGSGNGRFRSAGHAATGEDPEGVATGDFNHDGHLDLAVSDRDSSDVAVLLGNGAGGFRLAQLLTTVIPNDFTYGDPGPIQVGDFNSDGQPDIAVNTIGPGGTGEVETFAGSGTGTFGSAVRVTPVEEGVGSDASMALTDLNGDGHPDLVLVNGYSDQDRVQTLLGSGGGTFADGGSAAVGHSPSELVVGDFNGDHHPDVAVTNHDDGTVTVLLGNGAGGFEPASTVAAGSTPGGIATGDFNHDGHPDLAVINRDPSTLTILLGNGRGGFTSTPAIAAGSGLQEVVTGRFDADGTDDLAIDVFNDADLAVLLSSLAHPSNDFTIVHRTVRAHGKVAIGLKLPAAGVVRVQATFVSGSGRHARSLAYARGSVRIGATGSKTLTIAPAGAAARALKAAKRLRVTVKVTFAPTGGTARTRSFTLTARY
jgi:hypothetical protein